MWHSSEKYKVFPAIIVVSGLAYLPIETAATQKEFSYIYVGIHDVHSVSAGPEHY